MPVTPKKLNKSEFIRSQPATMSASEVVAAAKAAGIKLSGNLVYMVRGAKGSTKKTASKPPGKRTAGKASTPKTTTSKTAGKTAASKKATVKKATPKKTSTSTSPGTAKSAGTSKSEFIRLHPSLTAAEVIAAGEAQGLSFSSALVYGVRGSKGTKKAPAKKPSTPKKAAVSKADFVRQHAVLTPKGIVAAAKAEGITLDVNYVYSVRNEQTKAFRKEARAKAEALVATRKTSTAPKTVSNGSRSSGSSVEDLLKAAAAELGLGKAIEILHAERARVRAVIGG